MGAGVAGLSAAISSAATVYELRDYPGGICSSYYINGDRKKLHYRNHDEAYRFEIGGGHWIFGAEDLVLDFINKLSPVKSYERKSAVYFPNWDLYVPYPLQNHLSFLPKDIAQKAMQEIVQSDHTKDVNTLADWLELHFGKTLCELFFFPFHKLYTAGLFTKIEPQDKYKTPVDKKQIVEGFKRNTKLAGYNTTFIYPQRGLDDLIRKMADKCRVNYNKEVIEINTKEMEILFKDGTSAKYETLISTLPLNKVVKLTKLIIDEPEGPYTSVLVINIGAIKGSKCPDYHWLYIPESKSGFHRVGFYSNVDNSFLPVSSKSADNRVSIYVEKAYLPSNRPNNERIKQLCEDVVRELKSWKFIDEPEVIDPTRIEVAYTWSLPNSNWRQSAIEKLKENYIYQVGRYGLWKFQGIAKSIKDGLIIKYS